MGNPSIFDTACWALIQLVNSTLCLEAVHSLLALLVLHAEYIVHAHNPETLTSDAMLDGNLWFMFVLV